MSSPVTQAEDHYQPTYTYRLYRYTNGFGSTVFRAKQRWFGALLWRWVTYDCLNAGEWRFVSSSGFNHIKEWNGRDHAIKDLTRYSRLQNEKATAAHRSKKLNELKLVVIEDVNV